jgi:hypothetical protein
LRVGVILFPMAGRRSNERRDFLRAMRARLQPDDVGLPAVARRRRTAGLRIEETAALTGVSLTWYSALEGGKNIRVSEALLDKVARTLRLDSVEREYLRSLAAPSEVVAWHGSEQLLQSVLDGFVSGPAFVVDALWNVTMFNMTADVVYGMSQSHEANMLRRMLFDAGLRSLHRNWEEVARQMVAILHLSFGRASSDAAFLKFVAALQNQSTDFARWWNDQRVQRFDSKTAKLTHEALGSLDFHLASFVEAAATHVPLPAYTLLQPAANAATAAKIGALHESYGQKSGKTKRLTPRNDIAPSGAQGSHLHNLTTTASE